jgi:hypothetical protein
MQFSFIHLFIRSEDPHVTVQPTDTEQMTLFCISHIMSCSGGRSA